ncbi:fatty acid desaturase [Xylariaceae sp. FL1651]|nr:fatty acid desaturase [Xylariaceae sp. FL1651]
MPMDSVVLSPELTPSDKLILQNLAADIREHRPASNGALNGSAEKHPAPVSQNSSAANKRTANGARHDTSELPHDRNTRDVATLARLNDPASQDFEPTVFSSWDMRDLKSRLPSGVYNYLLLPYVSWAQRIARYETDVVMVTHLIMYFTTSFPSAVWLFYRFSYLHGILHVLMQGWYIGAYTLLRHQHIHQRGVLAKHSWMQIFDYVFPYVMDPLMGHTWNSYFYHHVKHHHVEGNGPDDLSSTVRYQRDNIWHFLHYVGRFYFFIWLDLPLYFIRKGRLTTGLRAAFWELLNYTAVIVLLQINFQASLFTLLIPLLVMRLGLMIGNWGQHAFVDADEPDSDYRSSITLIDVPSNRYCYNDGYHTSHHLNPLRHWRDHPVHFLQNKETYSQEHALVFHNIDYLMITVRLMMRDYEHLAKCLVPIGDQLDMTMEQRIAMLKRHTRKFSEEEIREKFGVVKAQ